MSTDYLFCFQDCVNSLYEWSLVWQLSILSRKCCTIDIDRYAAVYDTCLQSEYVSYLGVTIDKRLGYTEHSFKIARKAHHRANLIHHCFTPKNSDLLLKAYITYCRPMLEYNSPLCGHPQSKNIIFFWNLPRDDLPREFPGWLPWRAIPGWKNLDSLGLRRLRADYKILFGVIHTKSEKLFSLRNQSSYAATIIL